MPFVISFRIVKDDGLCQILGWGWDKNIHLGHFWRLPRRPPWAHPSPKEKGDDRSPVDHGWTMTVPMTKGRSDPPKLRLTLRSTSSGTGSFSPASTSGTGWFSLLSLPLPPRPAHCTYIPAGMEGNQQEEIEFPGDCPPWEEKVKVSPPQLAEGMARLVEALQQDVLLSRLEREEVRGLAETSLNSIYFIYIPSPRDRGIFYSRCFPPEHLN